MPMCRAPKYHVWSQSESHDMATKRGDFWLEGKGLAVILRFYQKFSLLIYGASSKGWRCAQQLTWTLTHECSPGQLSLRSQGWGCRDTFNLVTLVGKNLPLIGRLLPFSSLLPHNPVCHRHHLCREGNGGRKHCCLHPDSRVSGHLSNTADTSCARGLEQLLWGTGLVTSRLVPSACTLCGIRTWSGSLARIYEEDVYCLLLISAWLVIGAWFNVCWAWIPALQYL